MRGIDPLIFSRLNFQNQTIYTDSDPRMSIQIMRAKSAVMDASYWFVETIRERSGLGDLALAPRRLRAFGSPDRIYNIYLEGGVVGTSIREYPDYVDKKWKDQFTLGAGKAVAIAFDGEWEWHKDKRSLVTHEEPYLFWIDGSNKLQVQLWDKSHTKLELATGIEKISAIRGWKNINFPGRDHGVIVAYIKSNGKVYYRALCIQEDGSIAWEIERQVSQFSGTAVNINLFITNDYRTGFIIEDSAGIIHWAITDRNWAGMAIGAETLTANPVSALAILHAPLVNSFVSVANRDLDGDWSKEVVFTTRHRLYSLDVRDFEIVGPFNVIYTPDQVQTIGSNKYLLSFFGDNSFNDIGLDNSATLKFKGLYTLNADGVVYEPFQMSFYPENLKPPVPPEGFHQETLTAAPISVSLEFDYLSFLDVFEDETELLTANPLSATVILDYIDIENP